MGYIFKEKITYSQYDKFIKNYSYLSFMQENNWAKTKEYKNYLIVGILNNNELCAVALIIIRKKHGNNQFFIPNGYLIDYSNAELVSFMTENIKRLAHKYHAYVIDIYPYISTKNKNYNIIHNNLLKNNYKWTNEYIDKSKNVLIPLRRSNKKIPKTEWKRKYEDKDFYLKRGIFFEVSDNFEDIKRFSNLMDDKNFDDELIANLLINFKDRIKMIFAKIDLVFYLNFLKENKVSDDEVIKIEELIKSLGEEIDVGCALTIFPYNIKDNICEYVYNKEKESFGNLRISNGLLYEALKLASSNNFYFLKLSNVDLNQDYYVDNYQGFPIKYIGHYSLVINKIIYFLNKEVKKRRT